MRRDKEQTREKIVTAAGRILAQSGFSEFGVNAIARQAKVDKVLIYRYFGGLPEVMQALAEDTRNWPSVAELLGPGVNLRRVTDVEDALIRLLTNTLREIRHRKVSQEIMRWGLVDRNQLTDRLAEVRDRQWNESLSALPVDTVKYPDLDLTAMMALMLAGLTHMVLLSRTTDRYMGIDLRSNFGWQRLEKAIATLVKASFVPPKKADSRKSDR